MSDNEKSNLLTTVLVAVFAGALGSVITLGATGGFSVAELPETPENVSDTSDVPTLADSVPSPNVDHLLLTELQEALTDAAARRSQLADSLIQITRKVDSLESEIISLDAMNQARALSEPTNTDATQDGLRSLNTNARSNNRFNGQSNAQQRVENLVAAGVDEQTARDIQSRRDQYQLARLELFDQASREGWSESDLLNERLDALDTDRIDLRQELGDDAYDRYLFESGNTNRVGIASIITGSAADVSGLQTGDQIISHAGIRVFQVREPQTATRAGVKGEYVQLLHDRGGQALSAEIPRGLLGVTLATTRTAP